QLQSEITPRDAAFLQQLAHHTFHEIHRNAKGDAAVVAVVGGNGGVDADDFAVEINERTAARTGIDGSIGLQKIFDANGTAEANLPALARANDAVRHRLIESEGTTERQDPLTDPHAIAVSEIGECQRIEVIETQDRDIGFRIRPDL